MGNCFPSPLPEAPAASGTPTTFVVSRIFLGESDWDGNASDSAWQLYSFDLDGRGVLTPADQHCTPSPEAGPDLFSNWVGGVDNAFGRELAGQVSALALAPASADLAKTLRTGSGSLAISFDGLGASPDLVGVAAFVSPVRGGSNASGVIDPPGDWLSYPWHPLSTATAGDGSPLAQFSNGYVAGGEWVSAVIPPGASIAASSSVDLRVTIFFDAFPLSLVIHHAFLTAKFSSDGRSLREGKMGGVVSVTELGTAYNEYFGYFTTACGGNTDEGVIASFVSAADMRLDGSLLPKLPCDAISIGLGFEAEASTLATALPPLPTPRPCDALKTPSTCAGAHGSAGCCAKPYADTPSGQEAVLFSCSDGVSVSKVVCPASCGWDPSKGAYSCDGTAAEPTGEHPFGCGP